jgi:hypothetical protein
MKKKFFLFFEKLYDKKLLCNKKLKILEKKIERNVIDAHDNNIYRLFNLTIHYSM